MHPDPTSGDLELFEAAAPCLDVMGKARFFLGPVGAGANMKLVVNM
jgi:glyoxylate/succinic semialdehyde reductase